MPWLTSGKKVVKLRKCSAGNRMCLFRSSLCHSFLNAREGGVVMLCQLFHVVGIASLGAEIIVPVYIDEPRSTPLLILNINNAQKMGERYLYHLETGILSKLLTTQKDNPDTKRASTETGG